jgi:CRP/FNR family transcriptional regulator
MDAGELSGGERARIAQELLRIPYLRRLSDPARSALAEVCRFKALPRGRVLFTEGQPADGIFLILRGRIKIVRTSSEGREQVLHEEGAGVTLAEVPVFDGGGYVGSAVAVEDAEVLCVPEKALRAALDQSPSAALEVIRTLAARIRKLAAVVEDLSLRAVTERIATYLLREMTAASSVHVALPATRDELAAHVGTVREQASRALSELRAIGVITTEGRNVHIADVDRLRLIAGNPPIRLS